MQASVTGTNTTPRITRIATVVPALVCISSMAGERPRWDRVPERWGPPAGCTAPGAGSAGGEGGRRGASDAPLRLRQRALPAGCGKVLLFRLDPCCLYVRPPFLDSSFLIAAKRFRCLRSRGGFS